MHKKRDVLVALACIAAAHFVGSRFASGEDPAPPPEPWPCYVFSEEQPACPDCVDVNYCGTCKAGSCEATICSRCTGTQDASPAKEGFYLITEEAYCQTRYNCVKPNPCNGNACTCGQMPQGGSGEPTIIERPGEPCDTNPL
jgi:hypothetical protein